MKDLIFLEKKHQVIWIEEKFSLTRETQLVAVTAEALQSLEEKNLPHVKVSDHTDTYPLAAVWEQYNADIFELAKTIESFLAKKSLSLQFEGIGILSGQAYYLQYAVGAIATRVFLMRETIEALSPQTVMLFDGEIDPWFQNSGYARNPWIDVIAKLSDRLNFQLKLLRDPTYSLSKQESLLNVIDSINKELINRESEHDEITNPPQFVQSDRPDNLRLLFIGKSIGYDWKPIIKNPQNQKKIECFAIEDRSINSQVWGRYYSSVIFNYWQQRKFPLGIHFPQIEKTEVLEVSRLFDKWISQYSQSNAIAVLGINLLPALVPYLKVLTCVGPSLLRYGDALAVRVLNIVQPHAVCLFSIPWLSAKCFADRCRLQNIPIISYQHGGCYGTHIYPHHLFSDFGYADYFLNYGSGIKKPLKTFKPIPAKFVPVGSTRIAKRVSSITLSSAPKQSIKILWIGDLSSQNTVSGSSHLEDTKRYIQQRQCLEILASCQKLKVIYRPFPQDLQLLGTPAWLKNKDFSSIEINSVQPLEELIEESDIIITDLASSTTWNEVVALQKPLILYCDPQQIYLMPHFVTDLEKVCYWCKTEESLLAAMQRIVTEGDRFILQLQQLDTTEFIQKYILHRQDGQCIQRVTSFLEIVCRDRQPLEQWEQKWEEILKVTDEALTISKKADDCLMQGKLKDAILLYKQAIAIKPDLEILYAKLIRVYQKEEQIYKQQGNIEKALLSCYQVYSLQPNLKSPREHYYLGIIFQQQGKPEEAIECYCRAIAIDPTFARACIRLGNMLMQQRKFLAAIKYYQNAIALKWKHLLN